MARVFVVVALIALSWLSSARAEEVETDVVIVGAGISGLVAAQYVEQAGLRAMILEATGRVGGRIRTDQSLGFAFEEGAYTISESSEPDANPLLVATELYRSKVLDPESLLLFDETGELISPEETAEGQELFLDILGEVNDAQEEATTDRRVSTILDGILAELPEEERKRQTNYYLQNIPRLFGGEPRDLSLLWYNLNNNAYVGDTYILPAGMDQLLELISVSVDITYNTPVRQIIWNDRGAGVKVLASADDDESNELIINCRRVVVTVPLGVLKAGDITFSPELPSRYQRAINSLGVGHQNHFVLVYPFRFWPADVERFGRVADDEENDEDGGDWVFIHNVSTYEEEQALMFIAVGDWAAKTEEMSDEEVQNQLVDVVNEIFPADDDEENPPPIAFRRSAWSSNPWTKGARTGMNFGSTVQDLFTLGTPIEDTIYFGGEHTNAFYPGTLLGAYLSGVDAGLRVINTLAPTTPNAGIAPLEFPPSPETVSGASTISLGLLPLLLALLLPLLA